MKSIQLYTAMADNSGARREAGETVVVGKNADMIDNARAGIAIDKGSAIVVRATRKVPTK